jgi:hypothetical protein
MDRNKENVMSDKKQRFEHLLGKSMLHHGLTEAEENELLRLDTFLAETDSRHQPLPPEKVTELTTARLDELIKSTENLLEYLKRYQGE